MAHAVAVTRQRQKDPGYPIENIEKHRHPTGHKRILDTTQSMEKHPHAIDGDSSTGAGGFQISRSRLCAQMPAHC